MSERGEADGLVARVFRPAVLERGERLGDRAPGTPLFVHFTEDAAHRYSFGSVESNGLGSLKPWPLARRRTVGGRARRVAGSACRRRARGQTSLGHSPCSARPAL